MSFCEVSLQTVCPLLIGFFEGSLLNFWSSLSTPGINPSSDTLRTFSPVLQMASKCLLCCAEEALGFGVSPSVHLFSLGCLCSWSYTQSSIAQPVPGSIFLCFPSVVPSFWVLGWNISQMMNCVLHMVREDLSHFLCIWIISFSSTICWWKFSFLQ